MIEQQPRFIEVSPGSHRRRVATLAARGDRGSPGLMWLPGLKSDMVSTKATALAEWASTHRLGMTRFDYSGHGRSSGRFEEALISEWIEEAEVVLTDVTEGPQFLVGSSTGGHVALMLLRRLMARNPEEAARIRGLVLIAPAWDLTEELMWAKFDERQRRELMEDGRTILPSDYDPAGYSVSRAFIEDGRRNLLAGRPFDPGRPVHILQGGRDTSVPPEHARRLVGLLTGGWAEITEIPDGDHRLSRPEDLAVLYGAIAAMIERSTKIAG